MPTTSHWPEDLIRLILFQLGDPVHMYLKTYLSPLKEERAGIHAMSQLASSSRAFLALARPILYSGIHINGVDRARRLKQILQVNPQLGSLIKLLKLSSPYIWQNPGEIQCANVTCSIFPYLSNLNHLHLVNPKNSERRYFETIKVSSSPSLFSVRKITTEYASFSSIYSLIDFLDSFDSIRTLLLDLSAFMPANPVERADSIAIPRRCRNSLQTLGFKQVLRLGWPIMYNWLISTGRLSGLQDLRLPSPYADEGMDFRPLIHHTAQSLVSLAIDTSNVTVHSHMPFTFGGLPRLGKVSFLMFFGRGFKEAAIILPNLMSIHHQLEVIMDVELVTCSIVEGDVLWKAIEASPANMSYILNVSCFQTSETPSSVQEIKDFLPLTNLRGTLQVLLTFHENQVFN